MPRAQALHQAHSYGWKQKNRFLSTQQTRDTTKTLRLEEKHGTGPQGMDLYSQLQNLRLCLRQANEPVWVLVGGTWHLEKLQIAVAIPITTSAAAIIRRWLVRLSMICRTQGII